MAKRSGQAQNALLKRGNSNNTASATLALVSEKHSGPLPHPDILAGYDKLLPGSAERILVMAEEEQRHRHEIENKIISTESRDSLLGIIMSFVMSISFLAVGAAIIVLVQNTVATIAGGLFGVSGFAAVITSFIKYTRTSGDN